MQKLSAPPSVSIPPFIYFFQTSTPTIDKIFFDNIAPSIYGLNTKINSRRKVISSCLEDYKTIIHSFYISDTFIFHNRLRCNFKCIRRIEKKKNLLSKEHYCYKIYISLTKSSDIPISLLIFQKSQFPINESHIEKTKQFFHFSTNMFHLHCFSGLFKYLAMHNNTIFMPCHTRWLGGYNYVLFSKHTLTFALSIINVHAASLAIIVS